MVCVKLTFILFCCVFKAYTLEGNGTEQYAPHISAILKHLNSNPNKIYDYQKGIFINAQQKANIVELTVAVDVACTVNYPGVPCTEQLLTCHGFVQNENGEYRVLSDVLCNPKQEASVENLDEPKTDTTVSNQDSKIELSHEAVPSDQNADFVAVKADNVPCVGCPFDLNTGIDGVSLLVDTALRHIESEKNQKHVAIKVIRLQQQVVAGIKYILTIEVAPTVCQKDVDIYVTNCPLDANVDSAMCQITFLQKPWISKEKYIIKNNCTASQEYPTEPKRNERNDMSNEISTNSHITQAYDDKREMDPQRLSDLESQILNLENVKPVTNTQTNQYPKKVQYQEVIGNPSNNKLYTSYGVQNTIQYEPFVTSYQPENSFSTSAVNTIQQNVPTENAEQTETISTVEESYGTQNPSEQDSGRQKREINHASFEEKLERLKRDINSPITDTSESSESKEEYTKTNRVVRQSNLRKARGLNHADSDSSESEEDNTREAIRSKRNVDHVNFEEKLQRFRRELNSPVTDTSESSESREDDSKTNRVVRQSNLRKSRGLNQADSDSSESEEDNTREAIRTKRNVDHINFEEKLERFRRELNSPIKDTSESSESRENDSKTNRVARQSNFRKARGLNNADSDTSESEEDNTGEKLERFRRTPGSSSSESSESQEDNKTNSTIPKSYLRDGQNAQDSDSDSSESKEDTMRESITKRSVNEVYSESVRIKRNDDSSSSSESSSSEDKSKEKEEKKKKDDSNDTSSSSSSSGDKTKEDNRVDNNKDESDSSSSSSSSSSEEKSKRDGLIKRDIDERNEVDAEININKVKRSIGQLEKITQEEKFLVRDLADFAAYSLDKIDDDNHKRVILQILSAKKLKLDGIFYHIILRLGISHCSENEEDEICREKLFTNLTKTCKVLVHVEDDLSNPKVVKSQCQNIKKDDRDRNRTNYSRYRRDVLVGAPSNISLDDPRILEFTRDTLTELDSQSEHLNKHKIIKIVSATSQVVAGAKYQIKIVISLSDCLKNDTKPLDECDLPQNSTSKTCDIVVYDRPWLGHRETNVKCDDSDKEYSFQRIKPRRKRSLRNKGSPKVVGGIEEQSPDNAKASKYLKDILPHLDSESGHSNKLKIREILSVDKQVVAGELWRIKARITLSDCPQTSPVDPQLCNELEGSESRTCLFKIWDRPWLPHGREVQTSCENESKPYSFRLKRSLFGSKYVIPTTTEDANTPNPKVLRYLKTGLAYLDSQSRHKNKYMIKGIKKVSKQTVAGLLWHVSAEIALSDCLKQYHIEYCEELEDGENKNCEFVIWDQPWLPTGLQINITCENDRKLYSYTPKSAPQPNAFHNEELLTKFNDFATKHNKSYSSDTEFNYRFKVFRDNLNTIKLLNIYEQGTGRYGVTQFADLTAHEFSKSHGLRTDLRSENEMPFSEAEIPDVELPTEFDWRTKGAVTEVKNQGSCGSCWAFSTTGNVEGQYAIKYGKLLEFSEQELVDCDKLDEGCNGGLMDNAYRTIEKIGGLETESDYPYDAEDEKCHFNKAKARVQLTGAVNISHNEVDMAKWLVKNGPISIAINANAMQFYMGGVSHPWKVLCNPKNLDHGVLIVGYGVHNYPKFNKTLPYWIVKNSWGSSWGEQGYYRVYRGDGTCGLNQTPSSGIVA